MDVYVGTPRHPHIVCRVDAQTRVSEGEALLMQIDVERVHFFATDAAGQNVSLLK
jgi:hypothetical protein